MPQGGAANSDLVVREFHEALARSSDMAVAVAAILLTDWLLANSTLREARDTAIAAGAGMAIYFSFRLFRARQGSPDKPFR